MRILMVCLGNICRSPMAEYVLRHLVREAGLEHEIHVDSAATSRYQIGCLPHRGTQLVLEKHGIPCGKHRGRQITRSDYVRYDLIIGMDDENCANILSLIGGDPEHKVHSLLDWSDHPHAIADPWYTGDFDTTYADVREGCETLLAHLMER